MNKSQLSQHRTLYAYWLTNTSTSFMASKHLDIPIQNVCRYKRNFEEQGKLWKVKRDRCKVSGFRAWYLSCDPNDNITNQLELFD